MDRGKPESLVGSVLGNDFKVIKMLALSGHAKVYLAEQMSLGRRPVAVKVLHVSRKGGAVRLASAAMRREAAYLASLKSPVFPKVFAMGTTPDGRPYFVMKLIRGPTLEALIQDSGPMEPGVVLDILVDLCVGLAEMHEHGLLHRDMKPANVAVDEVLRGVLRPRILDMGSAKPVYKGNATSSRSLGIYYGTPAYMAPETAREGIHSEASDIYGLGCIAYEMLTGIKPLHTKRTRQPKAVSSTCSRTSRYPFTGSLPSNLTSPKRARKSSQPRWPEDRKRDFLPQEPCCARFSKFMFGRDSLTSGEGAWSLDTR